MTKEQVRQQCLDGGAGDGDFCSGEGVGDGGGSKSGDGELGEGFGGGFGFGDDGGCTGEGAGVTDLNSELWRQKGWTAAASKGWTASAAAAAAATAAAATVAAAAAPASEKARRCASGSCGGGDGGGGGGGGGGAAVTAGWRAALAAAWASGSKHPAPQGRITRPLTAGFERVVAITSYARLQIAAMRLAQRHAGVGVAAALRIVLVVVHCSTCFCQGVRSTFAQCTAAAGRLYGWRPAEG